MKQPSILHTSILIAFFSSGCLPALPSIGFNEQADFNDVLGTWKIKKASGVKVLGQSLLQYTFTDDCSWEGDTGGSSEYEYCAVDTLSGITFRYDFDEGDGIITISESIEQSAGLADGNYYVFLKSDEKMAWENADIDIAVKSYVFTKK